MNKKKTSGMTILAVVNLIAHLPSIFLLIFGVFYTIVAFTGAAQAGLLIIFSIPMLVLGGILFGGFKCSLLLFQRDPKGRKWLLHFSIVLLLVLCVCIPSLMFGPKTPFVKALPEVIVAFLLAPWAFMRLHPNALFVKSLSGVCEQMLIPLLCCYFIIYAANVFYLTRSEVKEKFLKIPRHIP